MIRTATMIILLLLSILSGINSLSVNVPMHMAATAGVDFSLEVTNDFSAGAHSQDSKFDSYGTLLAISPDGSNKTAVCYLGQSYYPLTSAADFHTIQIPAAVGPSGAFYSVATWDFNKHDDTCPNTGLQQLVMSQTVQLTGGQGEWSAFERNNHSPLEHMAENIPCGSYNCAKTCNARYYPGNVADEDPLNYESTYECIALCPGVELPSFDVFLCKSNSTTSTALWDDHTAAPSAGVTGTITVIVPTLAPAAPSKPPPPSSTIAASSTVAASTLQAAVATGTPSIVVASGSMAMRETIKLFSTGVLASVFGMSILSLQQACFI